MNPSLPVAVISLQAVDRVVEGGKRRLKIVVGVESVACGWLAAA